MKIQKIKIVTFAEILKEMRGKKIKEEGKLRTEE